MMGTDRHGYHGYPELNSAKPHHPHPTEFSIYRAGFDVMRGKVEISGTEFDV